MLDWQPPFAKWFIGGRLNVAVNCVDRHVEAGNGDKVAFHWEGEPGDTRTITYADLKRDVSKAANALTELGVKAGDRVIIYLPMIPEVAIAMLACARLGAAHSVVFGGFSAEALRTRIEDAEATVVITADGGYRRGAPAALKPAVDEAVEKTSTIRNVLVVRRTGQDVAWNDDRDLWWHDVVDKQSEEHKAEAFDSEHPLFILYTSGSTGKPKGILHTTGGYLTQCAYTHRVVFDLKPETDVYWCTADVGWVTGHSYIVYGPLANGATQVMYEGTPDTPAQGPLVGAGREVRRDDPLHRAHRDPHVHEVGRGDPQRARPVQDPAAGVGRRADQPGGVDLVPPRHRRRQGPRRRHLVADRDRLHHDQPAAGRHRREARLGA